MIETGQKAPDFTLPASGGGTITLAECAPKAVVLFFYPRDDTSGCTAEALDFTAQTDAFGASNAMVLGVSRDSLRKHENFIAKHDLGIRLLSDEDGQVCERYGVWVEKSMYGRKFMGIERATFLIDGSGKVARVWRKVKVPGHVAEALAAAQAL